MGPLWAPKLFHFAPVPPHSPHRRKAVLHLIELERLDDRIDPLHARPARAKARPAADHLPALQFARSACACTNRVHAGAPIKGLVAQTQRAGARISSREPEPRADRPET